MPDDRPADSDLEPPVRHDLRQVPLTHAEAHALRRSAPLTSAPLTPEEFKELGRLAEQGVSPLRRR